MPEEPKPNDQSDAAPGPDPAQAAADAAKAAEGVADPGDAPKKPEGDQETPPDVTPPEVAQLTDQQIAEIADPTERARATSLKAGWDKAMRGLADARKALDSDDVVTYVRELRELAKTNPGEVARRLRAEADYMESPDPKAAKKPPAGKDDAADDGTETAAMDKHLQSMGLPATADMTDTERVLVKLMTGLATQVRGLEDGRTNDSLDNQLAALRTKHGKGFDPATERLLLETAQKHGLEDLTVAYKIAFFDKERPAGTAAAYAALKEKGVNVEPPSVARPTQTTAPRSVEEILHREADKLGIA